MGFKIGNDISNVNSFHIFNGNIQLISEKKIILNNEVVEENSDCLGVFIFDNYFAFSNYDDYKTKIIDINSKSVKYIGIENIQPQKVNKKYVAYCYDTNFNSELILFNENFYAEKINGFTNKVIHFCHNSIVFFIEENKILAYILTPVQLLWKFNISQFGTFFELGQGNREIEIYKILGVYNNDLILILNDSTILKINIETGELNKHFELKLFSETENEITAQYNFIQLENNKLIYYRFGQYAEYDLEVDKVTYQFDIKEKLHKENLHDNIYSFIKEDDLLYFYISGFGSFSLPTVAILNIKTKEIIWKNVLDNPNVLYKDFQKDNSNLYLLDSQNTLHIFEKTS
ncbi:hypothetical protein BWK58_15310 [Flavobacterium columnare]|nr:hypothetical protein BWK58_15310 [Flavobacterium columnare]